MSEAAVETDTVIDANGMAETPEPTPSPVEAVPEPAPVAAPSGFQALVSTLPEEMRRSMARMENLFLFTPDTERRYLRPTGEWPGS